MQNNPKKILLIEDDLSLTELYKITFNLKGYDIENAANGEEGLQKARIIHPSIILLDVMMPTMNGLQVLEELKKIPETKDIPVIMVSNIIDNVQESKSIALGAVRYIVKSQYLPKQIIEIVNQILEENKKE